MEIYGTITSRSAVEQKTETFKVQTCVLDASYTDNRTGKTYENTLEFQVTGNAIEKLAAIPDQSRVKVFFNPQGRLVSKKDKPEEKFIAQNLNAWKFEILIPNQNGSVTQGNTENQQSDAGGVYNR